MIIGPLTVLSSKSTQSEQWQAVDYLGGVNEKQIYGRPPVRWTLEDKLEFARPFLDKHRIEMKDKPSNWQPRTIDLIDIRRYNHPDSAAQR